MLAKLCITCDLFGCKAVTSQITILNLANCICQQEFVDPKTEKSLPDSWSVSTFIHLLLSVILLLEVALCDKINVSVCLSVCPHISVGLVSQTF